MTERGPLGARRGAALTRPSRSHRPNAPRCCALPKSQLTFKPKCCRCWRRMTHPASFMAAAAAPPPALEAGAELGPYRVLRIARPWRHGHRLPRRRYAAAAASRAQAAFANARRHERQRARLKLEARAAAALTHPNIATVYALEEFDGQMVIASEYVEGETLRHEMERGPVPVEQSLAAAIDIARAVAAAHERGIVHRDLKPENILRARDGSLKILDFGLAQVRRRRARARVDDADRSGLVAGTPPYMAPEQLLGRGTDFRTDQFAFGVMIYEMVTGRHPFGGQSLPSTIAHILAGEPPTPHAGDGLPSALWDILNRCLQKDPEARFASTGELAGQLESLREASYGARRMAHATGASAVLGPSTAGTSGTSGTSAPPAPPAPSAPPAPPVTRHLRHPRPMVVAIPSACGGQRLLGDGVARMARPSRHRGRRVVLFLCDACGRGRVRQFAHSPLVLVAGVSEMSSLRSVPIPAAGFGLPTARLSRWPKAASSASSASCCCR